MFKLKTLYALFLVAVFLLFYYLYVNYLAPYPVVSMVYLLIAAVGYVYSYRASLVIVIASWVVFFPLFTLVYRIDLLNVVLPLSIFSCMVGICAGYKKIIEREDYLWENRIRKKESDKSNLEEELGRAMRFEEGVKIKEQEIINLYEITKKMSEGLRLEDVFRSLGLFLKNNFIFKRCSLLIFKREDEIVTVDREYVVLKEDILALSGTADRKKRYGSKLADKFLEGFTKTYITRSEDADIFIEISVDEDDIDSIAAIPLLSEKKMVGILLVENLPKADLERVTILSMQFALEMRKALLYEMVERMAITDSLTGLYVRRHFYERFEEELSRSKRYNLEFAVLMIDIDNFKRCNDTYGHLVGDIILKEIARIISEHVREIDIVSRYGGEELALVLPETGEENARVVAERLRRNVAGEVFRAYDEKVKITISVGFSVFPKNSDSLKTLIDQADEALYKAKKSGKNLVCEYGK